MPLILAIEPDRRQASQLTAMVRGRLHAELVLADSTERALTALGDRVPDLVLTSALLSPKDEATLSDRLRALDGHAAHVQTLTIPVLATHSSHGGGRASGVLSALRRDKSRSAGHAGCDPAVFAEQCKEYLERAATERATFLEQAAIVTYKEPAKPVSPSPVTGSEWVVVRDDQQDAPLADPAPIILPAGPTAEEQLPPAQAYQEPESTWTAQTVEPSMPVLDDQELVRPADSEDVSEPPRVDRVLREFLDLTAHDSEGPASLLAAVAALEAEEQTYIRAPVADPSREPVEQQSVPLRDPASSEALDDVQGNVGPLDAASELEFVDLSALLEPQSIELTHEAGRTADSIGEDNSPDVYEIDASGLDLTIDSPVEALPHSDQNRLATLRDLEDIFKNTPEFAPATAAPAPVPAVENPKAWVDIIEALRRDAEQLDARRATAADLPPSTPATPPPLDVPGIFHEILAVPARAEDLPPQSAASTPNASVSLAPAVVQPESTDPIAAQPEPTAPMPAAAPEMRREAAVPAVNPPEPPPTEIAAAAPAEAAPAAEAQTGKRKRKRTKNNPAQDEWGFFDPDQCGFAALIEKLEEINDKDDTPAPRGA